MKKILALVLALALVLSVASALAGSSKTTDDTTSITHIDRKEDEGPLMWKIETTEAAKALIDALNAALEAGDTSTVFPAELEVSPDMIVADVLSVAVRPEIADLDSYSTAMEGVAGVTKDITSRVLAQVDAQWFEAKAKTPADNTVEMTFDAASLDAMPTAANITLVVLVAKPAE